MTNERTWGCCGKKWGEKHAPDCPRGNPYQYPFLHADADSLLDGDPFFVEPPQIRKTEAVHRTTEYIHCPCCGIRINITLAGAGGR